MKFDPLEFVARATSDLAAAPGTRSGSAMVVERLKNGLRATAAFVAVKLGDAAVADIHAASGVGAADFRRLESRITKSSLWRMVNQPIPLVIDKLQTDLILNFFAFGTGTRQLTAVPIILRETCIGLLAIGFAEPPEMDEKSLISFLKVIASLLSQEMRVERAVHEESRKLIEENSHLKQELREKYDFSHLIGNSSPMRQVYDQVTQVARSNATVLLRGESGTGKELIANAIHYNSLRSKRPIIKVNCAALPETLIESELFGYERGAFTGAVKQKKGRFELADGGTLFLDEIGDVPAATQAKLLRVMQEREFERLGGTETLKVNVRLITATNKNLEDEIERGNFREDLFYRLNVFSIFLPPLRERKSDILLLAEHFLEKHQSEHGKKVRRISTPAIDMLTAYHFPGNVRELENTIERALIVCDSNVIHGHHLPPTLQTAEVSGTETRVTLEAAVASYEGDLIKDALKSTRGNVAKAAKMLDSTERILGYKINKYGIQPRRYR